MANLSAAGPALTDDTLDWSEEEETSPTLIARPKCRSRGKGKPKLPQKATPLAENSVLELFMGDAFKGKATRAHLLEVTAPRSNQNDVTRFYNYSKSQDDNGKFVDQKNGKEYTVNGRTATANVPCRDEVKHLYMAMMSMEHGDDNPVPVLYECKHPNKLEPADKQSILNLFRSVLASGETKGTVDEPLKLRTQRFIKAVQENDLDTITDMQDKAKKMLLEETERIRNESQAPETPPAKDTGLLVSSPSMPSSPSVERLVELLTLLGAFPDGVDGVDDLSDVERNAVKKIQKAEEDIASNSKIPPLVDYIKQQLDPTHLAALEQFQALTKPPENKNPQETETETVDLVDESKPAATVVTILDTPPKSKAPPKPAEQAKTSAAAPAAAAGSHVHSTVPAAVGANQETSKKRAPTLKDPPTSAEQGKTSMSKDPDEPKASDENGKPAPDPTLKAAPIPVEQAKTSMSKDTDEPKASDEVGKPAAGPTIAVLHAAASGAAGTGTPALQGDDNPMPGPMWSVEAALPKILDGVEAIQKSLGFLLAGKQLEGEPEVAPGLMAPWNPCCTVEDSPGRVAVGATAARPATLDTTLANAGSGQGSATSVTPTPKNPSGWLKSRGQFRVPSDGPPSGKRWHDESPTQLTFPEAPAAAPFLMGSPPAARLELDQANEKEVEALRVQKAVEAFRSDKDEDPLSAMTRRALNAEAQVKELKAKLAAAEQKKDSSERRKVDHDAEAEASMRSLRDYASEKGYM